MNGMLEVYYAEDDENISRSVKAYLEQKQCKVTVFRTIEQTRQALKIRIPSVILIDWNMPDGQGNVLCRWIRSRWEELPVIFLTVRGDSQDVISGFRDGADDYVIKPFELEVLYSRILALLRRAGKTEEKRLFCGHFVLDQEKMAVFVTGKKFH